MQLFILTLIICFVIFLFCLYKLGKDDIVLIRRNVPLEQLFNLAFLAAGVGLFSSRLFYVLANPAKGFFNPLVFLLFPYFPGLSLVGGVAGALAVLFYYSQKKKLPTGRILDFFMIALFCVMPIGYLGSLFLTGTITLLTAVFIPILYIILFIVLVKIFFPKLVQNNLQQGSIAALSLVLFTLISFLTSMIQNNQGILWFIDIPEVIAMALFIGSLGFLIRQEMAR